MDQQRLPYNRPHITGDEHDHISQAIANLHLSSHGPYTDRCQEWLASQTGAPRVLLTHSCTSALELAAVLSGVGPGDEVIMPSFTFVAAANAFVLRGATPVFVDIRPDTLNLNEELVAAAITPATRAIVPVHYAGVGCEMSHLIQLADAHRLLVVEDAAQGLLATSGGQPLGRAGQMATLSFHETKNVTSGEGGALLINDPALIERAELVWYRGTNRLQFERGEVDHYTWHDVGSAYAPSEITAAFLWPQLLAAEAVTARRRLIWGRYHDAFAGLEAEELVRRPAVPPDRTHNGHLYYLLLPTAERRTMVLTALRRLGVPSVFHYIPLHSSPAGRKYGRASGDLSVTTDLAGRLLRLPVWADMTDAQVSHVIEVTRQVVRGRR